MKTLFNMENSEEEFIAIEDIGYCLKQICASEEKFEVQLDCSSHKK